MARMGREFEKLVARIEQTLCPFGAIVTSPDKIKDRNTGHDREVDASIRYTVGSAPILITIECRDRNAAQDITWLEQIKSKKESIAAAQTIVVSREGFTEGAITYANRHGIILRQISEVTDAFWLDCLKGLTILERSIKHRPTYFKIVYFSHPDDEGLEQPPLADNVVLAIKENKSFATNKMGQQITLQELYDEALQLMESELTENFDKNQFGLSSKSEIDRDAECDAIFASNDIAVQTVRGDRHIEKIIFGIKYKVVTELLPPLKQMHYTDENGRVIDSFSMTSKAGTNVRVKTGWDQSEL